MTPVRRTTLVRCLAIVLLALGAVAFAAAQLPASLYSGLRWRLVGPFRSGRVLAVTGVPGHPNRFFIGGVDGGVWETNDAGRTWKPVFDQQDIGSIGAIAVAPNDPNVIYVGAGEADMRSDISYGNGVYKSTDGGRTWRHLGLAATRHIGSIVVDPRNPDIVLVAALGRAYGPSPQRGVYRSADGGQTWTKVLYKNDETGGIDLAMDPSNPRIVYAALWQAQRPAWNQYPPNQGPGSSIYKSTDEGQTWTQLSGHGLPPGPWGRIGLGVAFHDGGRRVFALIAAKQGGLYRSDDRGASWKRVSADPRIDSRSWYFSGIYPQPGNANVIFICDVAMYKSVDGGHTFTAIKGSPGGDDYHALWISRRDPRRMVAGVDQGAIVTVNGGQSWSSWYNQPLGQFYHVITDNRWPYWIYGAQQDSGTVGIVSRGDYGRITFRDWHSVGAGESGYIAPDPLDANIIFGGSYGGVVTRYDNITGQVQNVTPWPGADKYRSTWTFPIVFSPTDPHTLYAGMQYVLATDNGGHSWRRISPDLTLYQNSEPVPADPAAAKLYKDGENRGVVYTIAPSPLQNGEIWAGTDDGLIWLTQDGGTHWSNVTPQGLPVWSKISLIEASHFHPGTAYAAVDRHRVNDFRPYIYRTTDFGRSWTEISTGIPHDYYVHAVREDPVRRGLLYAGTERGIFVSFDNGENWQSLQLNLPVSSVRDMAIRDHDLIVATHGRALWVLDDITLLRHLTAQTANAVHLFPPAVAIRVRANENQDTPWPKSTPAGQNPPTGAIVDYYLPQAASGPVRLEFLNAQGQVIRRYSSADPVPVPPKTPPNVAAYWETPPHALATTAGMHRWVWGLRYSAPEAIGRSDNYWIAATPHDSFRMPQGPLVLPGDYKVELTVDGRTYTQPLTVKLDPRVHVAAAALEQQLDLELKIRAALAASYHAIQGIGRLRGQLRELEARLAGNPQAAAVVAAARQLGAAAKAAAGSTADLYGSGAAGGGLAVLNGTLANLTQSLDTADAAPTAGGEAVYQQAQARLDRVLTAWNRRRQAGLARLNGLMRQGHIPAIGGQ
ncbi:MAG: WD40/YVTN/BNR-like repeat-containing protein [Terriglobales bacterium]